MQETQFASAERTDKSTLLDIYRAIKSVVVIDSLMNKLDQNIIILNSNRQTVYVNNAVLNNYNIHDVDALIGLRPGEIFDCKYADCVNGCGTSRFCRECGAVNAILKTQLELAYVTDECVICSKDGTNYELAVTSKPFSFMGQSYTLFSIADIGLKKRMAILEKIFFHDIVNIAGGIHSMLQLMTDDRIHDRKKLNELLVASSEQLLNEINAHKILKAAESHDLIVQNVNSNSLRLLDVAVSMAENLKCAFGKVIFIDASSAEIEIMTDETLLTRVLMNMLTNALEASSVGDRVTAGVDVKDKSVVFWVHNTQHISDEHKHKIFVKSFTTKKRGSGLGTHSIKTLTEKYLRGSVSFETDEKTGTVFRVELPK